MNSTKQKILEAARKSFNELGVANVSIRQLSSDLNISHSNLIYHFKSKADIIVGLHDLLLQRAIELNRELDPASLQVSDLQRITETGFSVVYEFRFLFYDLLHICKSYPEMLQVMRTVEHIRSNMYSEVIEVFIREGLMRGPEYPEEYDELIRRIRVFSDHWLVSAALYNDGETADIIRRYADLFMSQFYPYLTIKGRKNRQL